MGLPNTYGKRPRTFTYGTTYGIDYGMGYEVNKDGKVDRVLELPVEAFKKEIPPPPAGVLPPGGALPPAPVIPAKDK